MDLERLRYDYTKGSLERQDLAPNPLVQFENWLTLALQSGLTEPNGMTLSTVGSDGRPSCRVVLLRGHGPEGLVFFSNYHSRKGQELAHNPHAAALFWWPELERQVRIEGRVHPLEPERSDAYFASRPYDSQVASAASPQSQVISSREALLDRIESLKMQYPEQVPRPAHWGGYCLVPEQFEFWQGRPSRIHDRFAYTLRPAGGWDIERLAP